MHIQIENSFDPIKAELFHRKISELRALSRSELEDLKLHFNHGFRGCN